MATLTLAVVERDDAIIARGYDQVADEYAALESAGRRPCHGRELHHRPPPPQRGRRPQDHDRLTSLPGTFTKVGDGWYIAERRLILDWSERRTVPAATFIRGDVREVDLPVGAFDAIVALYLIDNIAREDYPTLFRRFGELLRPNGRLLLSAEPGEDPWQQYTWLGVPMFINTVPTEELVQLLQEAGLSVGEHRVRIAARGRPADRVRLDHR